MRTNFFYDMLVCQTGLEENITIENDVLDDRFHSNGASMVELYHRNSLDFISHRLRVILV